MSIFRRGDSSPASSLSGGTAAPASPSHSSSAASAQRRRVTQKAPGTRIEGRITGATELLVEGEVAGEIRVEAAVMIGTDGVVQGPVTAHVVRVGGRVIGDVLATERVEVMPSGSLEGDIAAPRVVISEGAFFKGRIEMRSERGAAEKAPAQEPRQERQERRAKGESQTPANPQNPQNPQKVSLDAK
jgi:cytoskeletal protein CcmA (bactofilin family)